MASEARLTMDQFHALELWIAAAARRLDTPTHDNCQRYDDCRSDAFARLVEPANEEPDHGE